MSDEYLDKQKEIVKSMIRNYKEYEYNSYCFEINKYINLLNGERFKIGDIECYVSSHQLHIVINIQSDLRDIRYSINNVKFLASELEKICNERGLLYD